MPLLNCNDEKTILFHFICFVGYFLQAQTYNQFSIEAGGGLVAPLRGFDDQFKSNFSGLRHFDVGMRYMFNEYIGIKVSGNYQKFVNDPGGAIGSEQYGGNIQMYYNLRPMISNIVRFIGENFGVFVTWWCRWKICQANWRIANRKNFTFFRWFHTSI